MSSMMGLLNLLIGRKRLEPDSVEEDDRALVKQRFEAEQTPAEPVDGAHGLPSLPLLYCPLCLDSTLAYKCVGALTSCGHVMHQECWMLWEGLVKPEETLYCPHCLDLATRTQYCRVHLYPREKAPEQPVDDEFQDAHDLSLHMLILQWIDELESRDPSDALSKLVHVAIHRPYTRIPLIVSGANKLVSCLHSSRKSPQALSLSCMLLGHCISPQTPNERLEQVLVRAGIVSNLSHVLNRHKDPSVVEAACYVMGKIICEDPALESRIAVPALASALKRYPDHPLIVTYTCYALSGLMLRPDGVDGLDSVFSSKRLGGILFQAISQFKHDADVLEGVSLLLQHWSSVAALQTFACQALAACDNMGLNVLQTALYEHISNETIRMGLLCTYHAIVMGVVSGYKEYKAQSGGEMPRKPLIQFATWDRQLNEADLSVLLNILDEYPGSLETHYMIFEIVYEVLDFWPTMTETKLVDARALGIVSVALEIYADEEELCQKGQTIMNQLRRVQNGGNGSGVASH
jgi:hypothetical protein